MTEARRSVTTRARAAIARRLDPAIGRRAVTLVGRGAAGTSTGGADITRAALERLRVDVRKGRLDAGSQALVDDVVVAYLDRVAKDGVASGPVVDSTSRAFGAFYRPEGQPAGPPAPVVEQTIIDQFHRLYYHVSTRTWKDTTYRGIVAYKCPTDMWVYAELVDRLQPGLVIETGTFRGGSALFLADVCERNGHGRVVSIDIDVQPDRPEHPRLQYIEGSSVADDVVQQVRDLLPDDGSHVLVILDSDHSRDHVAAELAVYGPMVTVDSYVVVEDSNVNGHPAAPLHGPGPWEAAHEFLAVHDEFEIDHRCERYGLTQNPDGYLRRRR